MRDSESACHSQTRAAETPRMNADIPEQPPWGSKFSPSLLPPVTSVDIVILKGISPDRVDGYMAAAKNAPAIEVRGAAALRIAKLWRQLPSGNQARCHVPPFGLRFRNADRVLCQGSLCWRCNNIYGDMDGEKVYFEFDAGQPVSRELLADLRRLSGEAALGDDP